MDGQVDEDSRKKCECVRSVNMLNRRDTTSEEDGAYYIAETQVKHEIVSIYPMDLVR